MKKTSVIHLVLITAALAACNKPMYQQQYYTQGYYPGDPPDSTNSCPVEYDDYPPDYYNWFYGFRPYGSYYVDLNMIFRHRNRYGSPVHRAGFGFSGRSYTVGA